MQPSPDFDRHVSVLTPLSIDCYCLSHGLARLTQRGTMCIPVVTELLERNYSEVI